MKRLSDMRYAICDMRLVLALVFLVSGCVVRTYPVTKDRVDQDLTIGNRGYLKGEAPAREVKARKKTRTTQALEIELYSPIKFERMPKPKPEKIPSVKIEDTEVWGNRGFITESEIPEVAVTPTLTLEKYTVQKGDTLQKISKKFYGTTKKWTKIYEANKAILTAPDKIYPGQVINIPTDNP